ncbi:RWD domain-containing protein 2A [Plodia interpunctella]|uniref:RWD domain-containing protein 2A n=1 Tax=Plodia interpunctella TaxID=58824 RepID=UPI002368DC1F|nr:RWD domain-containing protein 2A [Plodia interpunctella]
MVLYLYGLACGICFIFIIINCKMSIDSVRETLCNNLTQQLAELELLKSMYPNSDEIVITDSKVLTDINNFIENKLDYIPNHLDFTLQLYINNMKLEFCVNLPTYYPEREPDIYVRCNQLNRQQETNLNTELIRFIKDNYSGEVCIYTAISWLQENIQSFINEVDNQTRTEEEPKCMKGKFVRLWIYSHHIYNKKKRDEILKTAKELKLTGFCLPGKPGIICVEGLDVECHEWWRNIKSMSWKKIMIRNTETFESVKEKQERKFNNFEEIIFRNSSNKYSKHADMSGFSKYMEQFGLSQAFNEVFRLGGDS